VAVRANEHELPGHRITFFRLAVGLEILFSASTPMLATDQENLPPRYRPLGGQDRRCRYPPAAPQFGHGSRGTPVQFSASRGRDCGAIVVSSRIWLFIRDRFDFHFFLSLGRYPRMPTN
jgi:hypothetical protein